MGKAICAWLTRNKDVISALTALVGVPLGLIGLFITIHQLGDAKRQLEAATIFSIQTEGRNLLKELQTDPALYKYMLNPAEHASLSPEDKKKGNVYVARILQYFSTIAIQKRAGNISEAFWPAFEEEICQAFEQETIKNEIAALKIKSPAGSALLGEIARCK